MRSKLTMLLLFCAGILSAGLHVNQVSGLVKDAGALEIVTEQPVPAPVQIDTKDVPGIGLRIWFSEGEVRFDKVEDRLLPENSAILER